MDETATRNRIKSLEEERVQVIAKSEGGKIILNGIGGKLNSSFSVLYAPHLFVAMTLTGQLSMLMLIERAHYAGIPAVSGNTDGVVFLCPRDKEGALREIIKQWETDTGFVVEDNKYKSLYNSSVNTYIAVFENGKTKRKGAIANPWKDNDLRGQISKNPQTTICSEAILEFITKGTPIEETIRASKDVREFVTVIKVTGGAQWRGQYLAKVVRYYWSTDGDPILYSVPSKNGTHKKVSKTDGARPLMELPDALPDDIDYERYIQETKDWMIDLGVIKKGGLL